MITDIEEENLLIEQTYGWLFQFSEVKNLTLALKILIKENIHHWEVYSPFPLEIDEIHHHHHHQLAKNPLPLITLITGILAGVGAFLLQYLYTVHLYPLNIGGRPYNSWPMYIPLMFELTILFSAYTMVIFLILLNKMPRWNHPLWNIEEFKLSSQDQFFLCLKEQHLLNPQLKKELGQCGVKNIFEVPL